MTDGQEARSGPRLLPVGWHRAPLDLWHNQRLEAVIFAVANFVFGMIGIWLPIWNSVQGHGAQANGLQILQQGQVLLFAIPFLAAVSGAVFAELWRQDVQAGTTRGFLAFVSLGTLFLCGTQLQIHLLTPPAQQVIGSQIFQVVVGAIAITVGVYMFSILKNESTGSPAEDLKHEAAELAKRADDAQAKPGDFDQ